MKRFVAALIVFVLLLQCAALADTMKIGSKGSEVKSAQQRLIELGYLSGSADGSYGKKTAEAVSLFQYFSSLEETGEIDEATLEALYAEDARALRAPLKKGDRGDDVKALQEMLIRYGFLKDRADGAYGKNTEKAVTAFQEHLIKQGLTTAGSLTITANGVADSLTQEFLFSPYYTLFVCDLAEGDVDDEVLRVENRLRQLDYLDAVPDTEFDAYAVACIRAFRADAGLPEGEIVDRETYDALFSEDAALAPHCVLHDISYTQHGIAIRNAQNALIILGCMDGVPDGDFGPATQKGFERLNFFLDGCGSEYAELFADTKNITEDALRVLLEEDLFVFSGDVDKNSDKNSLSRVQRRLSTLFYSIGGIDGIWGKRTANAITKFQENNGLPTTGIADEATQRALFSAEAVGNWTPYKLEVSIDDQRVYVYELNDEKQYELIDTFICSTGVGERTPRGIYTSTRPLDRWHYFVDSVCWAQYAYQITGPIYFHSWLYREANERSVMQSSVNALGTKASHGCIRLKPENAKWIYENCEKGTIVVIY